MKVVRRIIIVLIIVFSFFWMIDTTVYAEEKEYPGYKETGWVFFEYTGFINKKRHYCKILKDEYVHTIVMKEITPVIYHERGIETRLNFYKNISSDTVSTKWYNWFRGVPFWATERVLERLNTGKEVPGFEFNSSSYGGAILKDEKDGYYQLAACQNFFKYQVRMYENKKCIKKINVFIPTGEAYLKLRYGGNSKEGSYFR